MDAENGREQRPQAGERSYDNDQGQEFELLKRHEAQFDPKRWVRQKPCFWSRGRIYVCSRDSLLSTAGKSPCKRDGSIYVWCSGGACTYIAK
jgi:hypothetical protein